MRSLFFVSLALLLANFVAAHNPVWNRRHPVRAPLAGNPIEQNVTSRALVKRFDGARFTFYDAGLGACGKVNSNRDFIVAMNSAQFAGGARCFQTITITVNGKSTSAQVTDQCPGCPFGGLDFSRGLFNFFASESAGVLQGSWTFGGGAPVVTTPKSTYTPPPKTTEKPTPTSTTPPTTTHTSTSLAASSSALSASQSQSASAAPVTSSVAAPPQISNLEQMYLVLIQMGGIAFSGGSGSAST